MFKENFKNELNNIKPNDQVKSKILNQIENAQKLEPIRKRKATIIKLRWTSAVAAFVIVCLVCVSVFGIDKTAVIKNDSNNNISNSSQQPIINNVDNIIQPEETIQLPKGLTNPETYETLYSFFGEKEEESYRSQAMSKPMFNNGSGTKDDGTVPESSPDSLGSKGDTTPTVLDKTEFSETNTQVEGVDESDIVKTDGKYIYILRSWKSIVQICLPENGKITKKMSLKVHNKFSNDKYIKYSEMYVNDNRLTLIGETTYNNETPVTVATIYDITNPQAPKLINYHSQTGSIISSRISNGVLFVFTNQKYYYKDLYKDILRTYVPFTGKMNGETPIDEKEIYIFNCNEGVEKQEYLVAASVNIQDATVISRSATMGGGSNIYATAKNIYVVKEAFDYEKKNAPQTTATSILRFAISDGKITPVAIGSVKGGILNQFSMAEEDGNFRIVTTVDEYYYRTYKLSYSNETYGYWTRTTTKRTNALYILDDTLNILGKIENLAPDEKIYSARLSGDIGYFVTYRQVDPLFAVDLTDPKNPKILSKLKIPGFSSYLHPYGDGLLLGIGQTGSGIKSNIKLSMFDISNPANVAENHVLTIDEEMAEVLSNHKATLISVSKNLIGFSAGYDGEYYLFSYDKENGFVKKAVLKAPTENNRYNRGIFINDYLYICNEDGICSYNMNNFSSVQSIKF